MNLVKSGDYVDEVWFFASEELLGGAPWWGLWFMV
jgi:hypothetical protein